LLRNQLAMQVLLIQIDGKLPNLAHEAGPPVTRLWRFRPLTRPAGETSRPSLRSGLRLDNFPKKPKKSFPKAEWPAIFGTGSHSLKTSNN
jgi:hypothetical protein